LIVGERMIVGAPTAEQLDSAVTAATPDLQIAPRRLQPPMPETLPDDLTRARPMSEMAPP
jgi:hypothetical protein